MNNSSNCILTLAQEGFALKHCSQFALIHRNLFTFFSEEDMINTSRSRIRVWECLILIAIFPSLISISYSQEANRFALSGQTEVGGGITFQSTTSVTNGQSGDAYSVLSISPYIGHFVSDGLEIGVNPFGITQVSYSGSTSTQVRIFIAPSYNFNTGGRDFPFIEGLVGVNIVESNGGFGWGGRGGLKHLITERGLLILGVQYLEISRDSHGAPGREGYNELTVSAGFTLCFN
jgi:hypothetical protein